MSSWLHSVCLLLALVVVQKATAQEVPSTEAQKPSYVNFIFAPVSESRINALINDQSQKLSAREDPDELATEVIASLYKMGYLEASIDSTALRSDTVIHYLHIGSHWRWAQLQTDPGDADILSRVRYREKLFTDQPLSPVQVQGLTESILVYLENHGYPFASVRLDSLRAETNTLHASLRIEKHAFMRIDSIVIQGNSKLSSYYVQNYIGVRPGDIYSEKRIAGITNKLNQLAFVTLVRPPEVVFTEEESTLYLVLDKKKTSNFNGVLGLQPDDVTGDVVLTGDVRLFLQNAFNIGESMELNWRRLQSQTQDLKVKAVFPYLFRTPFGLEGFLQLYRRDTTFSTVTQNAAINYYFTGTDYFKVFVNRQLSSLISTDQYATATTLPENADVTFLAYGIGYTIEKLDYRFNPRKGFRASIEGSTGEKEIRRNAELPNVDYDALDLTTVQYDAKLDADGFIPLFRRATLNLGMQAAFMQNDNLFRNELYRIGGLKTLRGFDEESIFASTYAIGTTEFRFLLDRNSYLYTFFDGAYYERAIVSETVSDTPFGFGAGITFETAAGIFSINYALGRQFDNPIELRTGKVHFGFVNFF